MGSSRSGDTSQSWYSGSLESDHFVSEYLPGLGNDGAIVPVDASHPPDFHQLLARRTQGGGRASSPIDPNLRVELCDRELWEQFSRVGTEMIVTKSGRRMFPGYRVKLSGLDPNTKYCLLMDIVNVDQHRYKFQQGEWMVAGRGEPHSPQRLFLHPGSPASGEKWMDDVVSFNKIKLTNSNVSKAADKIVLNSMHRYQPRVHIIRTDDVTNLPSEMFSTFAFPQTVFITVTAYQNGEVTKLKIDNNPFAKGFRENGGRAGSKNLNSTRNTTPKSGRNNSNIAGSSSSKEENPKRARAVYETLHSMEERKQPQPDHKPDQLRNWMTSLESPFPNLGSFPMLYPNVFHPTPFTTLPNPFYPPAHHVTYNYPNVTRNVTSQNIVSSSPSVTSLSKSNDSVYSMLHATAQKTIESCQSKAHSCVNAGSFPNPMFLC
uniref:T-box transcription factor Tbx6a n=1 Tax=Phallusia mammillata TaxID=59560 RepID=A0A6F9DUK6_9ASCI|nr:T-box transcription factor Tbx6a [Phallusia mammillata]